MVGNEYYQKTELFSIVKDIVNYDQLAALCELIQAPNSFYDYERAFKRLKLILPIVKEFNSFNEVQLDSWINVVDALLNAKHDFSYIKQAYTLKNSTNKIGAHLADHEFYAALIADIHDNTTEAQFVVGLALVLAIKSLPEFPSKGLPSLNQLKVVLDGIRKGGQRNSVWSFLLTDLLKGDRFPTKQYLRRVRSQCDQVNLQQDQKINASHKEFARALLACVIALIAGVPESDCTKIKPPISTPHVPKTPNAPKSDEEDNDDFELIDTPEEHSIQSLPIRLIRQKPKPSEEGNYTLIGLSDDDSEQVITVVASPVKGPDVELLSETSEKLQGRYSGYISELDNQYLPIRWSALNAYEINEIYKYLTSSASSTGENKIKLVIALTWVTGQTWDALMGIQMGGNVDEQHPNCIHKVNSHYYWCHLIPKVENPYQPDDIARSRLNIVGNCLPLPLPSMVGALLDSCLKSTPSVTLESALGVDRANLKNQVKSVLTQLRITRRNRSRISRLRSVLFDSLMQIRADEISAYTILGLDDQRPLTGLYYATFRIHDLQMDYCAAVDRVLPNQSWPAQMPDFGYPGEVGSKLAISIASMQEIIGQMQLRCEPYLKGARNPERVREAHNRYTSYVVMLLLFSTGHRAVNDPFHDPNVFLLDHNALLITDKVELQEHEGRLVWLSDLAIAQYKAYLNHLAGLVSALSQFNRTLANEIAKLLASDTQPSMPLFFYLTAKGWESVKPASLAYELGDVWPFPFNANRHFLSTQLRRLNVPCEYISYQLGHAQIGQLPFGKFSLLAPYQVAMRLRPALKELEEQCGWKCLNGLRRYGELLPSKNAQLSSVPSRKFGPERRERNKNQKQKITADAVRSAIRKVRKSSDWDFITEVPGKFIDEVLAEIAEQSKNQPYELIRRQNLFRRFLKYGRYRNVWRTKLPSMLIELKGEKSPITYLNSGSLIRLNLLKKHVLNYLTEQFKRKTFPPKDSSDSKAIVAYLAICRLSALVFGQLCDSFYLENMERTLSKDVHRFEDKLWVTFYETTSVGEKVRFRWFPDAISSALIVHLRNKLTAEIINKISVIAVQNAYKEFIAQWSVLDNLPAAVAKDVIDWVKIENALYFPGVIRACLNADIETWSLSESAWCRLITGKPATLHEIDQLPIEKHKGQPFIRSITSDLKTEKEALAKLRECLQSALPVSSGNREDTSNVRNNAQSREYLKNQLKQWHEDWGRQCSNTLSELHGWINSLLIRTQKQSQLKISSIYTYFNTVGTALIEQCWELDLHELEEDELIQAYEQVLNYGKDSFRPQRAARLREFHDFIVEGYGALPVDFDELEPRQIHYGANGNLVTVDEYLRARDLLENDSYAESPIMVNLQVLVLCLIYRNGLRTGESIRLLVSDVIADQSPLVYIRNNRFGVCKSINGVRQIPFFERMDAKELELLKQWVASREHLEPGDVKAPLFTKELLGNSLIVRQQVTQRIIQALRIATGDSTIKIRHLRHAFANYFVASIADVSNTFDQLKLAQWTGLAQHSAENFEKKWFGQSYPSRRGLYQLANLIGHGSPETTIKNYIHCLDMLIPVFRPTIPAMVTPEDMMVVLGYSAQSSRTTIKRWRLEFNDVTMECLASTWMNKLPLDHPLTIAAPPKSVEQPLPPQSKMPNPNPSLDCLANMLVFYSQGRDLTFLARHYFFDPKDIENWINVATSLQHIIGYKRFKLKKKNLASGWSMLATKSTADAENEDQEFAASLIRNNIDQEFVKRVEAGIENNDEKLLELIDTWTQVFKPKTATFYAATQQDAEKLIFLLEEFGVKRRRIYLRIPKSIQYQIDATILDSWLRLHKIPLENIAYTDENKLPNQGSSKSIGVSFVPGITICSVKKHGTENPYAEDTDVDGSGFVFTTEFINYYIFLAAVVLAKNSSYQRNYIFN